MQSVLQFYRTSQRNSHELFNCFSSCHLCRRPQRLRPSYCGHPACCHDCSRTCRCHWRHRLNWRHRIDRLDGINRLHRCSRGHRRYWFNWRHWRYRSAWCYGRHRNYCSAKTLIFSRQQCERRARQPIKLPCLLSSPQSGPRCSRSLAAVGQCVHPIAAGRGARQGGHRQV